MASIRPIQHVSTFRLLRPAILLGHVAVEFMQAWIMALIVITSVMFLAMGGREFLSSQQSGLLQIVKALPLFLPVTLPYTIPFSLLVAITLTFGRLSADNEISAIRTAGINLLGVVAPILAAALMLSALNFYLTDTVTPRALKTQRALFRELVEKKAVMRLIAMPGQSISLPEIGGVRRFVSINDFDPHNRYLGVAYHETKEGQVQTTIFAESAVPTLDAETGELTLTFYNAAIQRYDVKNPRALPRQTVVTGEFTLQAPPMDVTAKSRQKTRELSISELRVARLDHLDKLREEREKAGREQMNEKERETSVTAIGRIQDRIWEIDTEIQMRIAMALSCFTFALIAIPLGIEVKKGNKLVAFLISVLLVIVLYYPLVVGGKVLAQQGAAPAWVCMWAANAVLAVIGGVMMVRVVRQ